MKVFRKITQVIIVAIIVIAAHSCYKDDANHHYRIPFKNDADYSLYILSESKEHYFMSPHYQDTILQSYYCDINGSGGLSANPNNITFQHEYGHYLQSQKMGIAYLNRVGIPSLFSNHNHDFHPVEQDANRRAFLYFNKHIDGFYKTEEDMNNEWGWDFDNNPLNVDGSYTFGQYVDYKDADDLKLLEGLSIHASLIDYYGWTMSPIMLIGNTIYNTIYYNHQY